MLNLSSILVLMYLAFGPDIAQPSTGRRVVRAVHHCVAGDLVTMRAARELEGRIRRATERSVDAFVLELHGDRWRADVVHEMAASLRSSGVRTIVWLRDRKEHCVGAGHAALGMVADECWIDPDTAVCRREADHAGELAPKGTNHPRLTQELMSWGAEAARTRGTDPLALRMLLGEPATMWAVKDGPVAAWRLTPSEPGAAATEQQLIARGEGSGFEARFTAEQVVGLKLASAEAAHLGQMFAWRGVSPNAAVPMPLGGDIEPILEAAAKSLDGVDRQLDSIETELKAKPRGDRADARRFLRELGARVLKRTAQAGRALDSCEGLLEEDAEIIRTPPPGVSAVGADADQHAAEWRRAFQTRRSTLRRLEKKARGYAGN